MANPQFVSGEVVTAAKLNQLPKGRLAYAEITASSAAFTTEADITGLTITFTAVANRLILLVFDFHVTSSVGGDAINIRIKEGSTVLGRADITMVTNRAQQSHCQAFITPTAGSHTYKISGQRAAGTGNCSIAAATDGRPAGFWADDIGSST